MKLCALLCTLILLTKATNCMSVELETHPFEIEEEQRQDLGFSPDLDSRNCGYLAMCREEECSSVTLTPATLKFSRTIATDCVQTDGKDCKKHSDKPLTEYYNSLVDPKKTIITGTGLKGAIVGTVSNFTIIPVDKDGNSLPTTHLQLLLRHNMSEKHSKFVTNCEPSFCIVYYVCIEAGSYLMNLLLENKHITGSPFVVKIHPGPMNASRTFAMAVNSQGKAIHVLSRTQPSQFTSWHWIAGEANLFTINPRDSYGNKIPHYNFQQFTFTHNLSISSPLKMRSEVLPDGRLQVIANTSSTEPFQLSILVGEEHILNSPIEVQVAAGEVCSHCSIIQGTGLISAQIGKQSELQVLVRDQWSNPNPNGFLSATCHSPNCSLAIENHQNGWFSILFTPYKEEQLYLSILVNGLPIVGSPFSTMVKGDDFPLPPVEWHFIGPFDWTDCSSHVNTPLRMMGFCNYFQFKHISRSSAQKFPSSLLKSGKVTWRNLPVNATGFSSVKFALEKPAFFGWAVGNLFVNHTREYYVICDGVDEYYLRDIPFSGGSWHPVFLEEGTHVIILFITSDDGHAEFYCDFMSAVEKSNWPIDAFIDPSILPGNQSWLMIIELVVLFKCLEAVLGPLHLYANEQEEPEA